MLQRSYFIKLNLVNRQDIQKKFRQAVRRVSLGWLPSCVFFLFFSKQVTSSTFLVSVVCQCILKRHVFKSSDKHSLIKINKKAPSTSVSVWQRNIWLIFFAWINATKDLKKNKSLKLSAYEILESDLFSPSDNMLCKEML